jgi:hypothetical protein
VLSRVGLGLLGIGLVCVAAVSWRRLKTTTLVRYEAQWLFEQPAVLSECRDEPIKFFQLPCYFSSDLVICHAAHETPD